MVELLWSSILLNELTNYYKRAAPDGAADGET